MQLNYNEELNRMTNGYYVKLVQCYRPHSPIPSRQELLETKYEPNSFFNLKDLCDDVGVDYDERMKTTKDTHTPV